MTNLYSRLYKYRERSDRSVLENFLTEALADLLNRDPINLTMGFVEECIQIGHLWTEQNRIDFCNEIDHSELVRWKTQVQVNANGQIGIADLVLYLDAMPRMVVENKIWAPIGHREDIDIAPNEVQAFNQLHIYDCWLAHQLEPDVAGVLVLLSHSWAESAEFLDLNAQGYCLDWRALGRWQSVDLWLRGLAGEQGIQECCVAELSTDLADFLNEHHIAGTIMTANDLAAAEIFMNARVDFLDLFQNLRAVMLDQWNNTVGPPRGIHGRYPMNFSDESPVIWDWFYLGAEQQPQGANWHVVWGFFFGSDDDWLSRIIRGQISEVPTVFVALTHEEHAGAAINFAAGQPAPIGWIFDQQEQVLVTCTPTSDFFVQNQVFNVAVANWMTARIPDLVPVLPRLT